MTLSYQHFKHRRSIYFPNIGFVDEADVTKKFKEKLKEFRKESREKDYDIQDVWLRERIRIEFGDKIIKEDPSILENQWVIPDVEG